MIKRHPIPNTRRQQKPLLSTALYEVLRHPKTLYDAPDRTPLYETASDRCGSLGDVRLRVAEPPLCCELGLGVLGPIRCDDL
jgi:hypothetical protein